MEKSTPVRNPHASTADLLTWSETPIPPSPADFTARRSHKHASGISPAMFGGQMTEEEVESINKRKPCSGPKLREITGSRIFASDIDNGTSDSSSSLTNPNNRTSVRICQQAMNSISQISFSAEENVSPKKPTSLPEVAKQRELCGSLENESDVVKRQLSDAKCKELSGHDIFGPPPEIPPKPLAARNLELKGQLNFGEPAPRIIHTSVKVSNPAGGHSNIVFGEHEVINSAKKINEQKFHELTGNDIFKDDVPPASAEKPLSSAKLKEMSGSDIFADGKAATKDYFGGVRKPPGGGSTIALV